MRNSSPLIGITTEIKADELKENCYLIETTYARAIAEAGGIPILLPSLCEKSSVLRDAVANIDGLLLPGGRDMDPKYYNEEPHPKLRLMSKERTESEMVILDEALKQNIPVLGICGGMQLINVFFGGSLYQDIPSMISSAIVHEKGALHEILVEDGTLLGEIVKEKNFSTKSYHHQSVKAVGKGLKISARCPDGIIEAIEKEDHFIIGIQWHPEREESGTSKRIFRAFIDRCREK
ncbi:MAG TPA: gamma-glutamyl-gamma-aminobutyrate hydrolase family protein [Thermodesulfobacteriota bacterium]|jgi:putative glutamine amidotransferase|nr:gamma-glutamyl-gamma-aminobutyrate hydrolase family protein [Thermodesulfobacteriota bacterium]